MLPEIFGFVEADRAEGIGAVNLARVIAQQRRARPDIGFLAAPDLFRLFDRRAAFPDARCARILALGQRAFAEIAAHQQRIGIDPLDPALALLVEHEAALNEALGGHVEFAQHGGILAPVAQRDHAQAIFGRQAGRALVHPFAPFGLGQRIDVKHGFPLRVVGAIAFQRGPAHQPARVLLVLPEIVQAVRADRDIGDAIFAIVNRQRLGLDRVVARVAREQLHRPLVLGADPVERLVATGFFEPDVTVLLGAGNAVLRGDGGGACNGHGSGNGQRGCEFQGQLSRFAGACSAPASGRRQALPGHRLVERRSRRSHTASPRSWMLSSAITMYPCGSVVST